MWIIWFGLVTVALMIAAAVTHIRVIGVVLPWMSLVIQVQLTIDFLRLKPRSRLRWVAGWSIWLPVAAVVAWALIFLVTQGNTVAPGAHHVNRGWLPGLESFLLIESLYGVLFVVPEIIRRKLPMKDASDQALRFVPAALAIGAAMLTGSFLLALHFFNEPLATISRGPLAASIVAVMALLAPFYQLIARACWRYGLAEVLDPSAWWAKWSDVIGEIRNFRTNQARAAAEKPRAAAEKPRAVAEKPRAVAEKPRAVAEKPRAVAEKRFADAEKRFADAMGPIGDGSGTELPDTTPGTN